jgi:geranylgeranylglycerol-phosphate geranylgeranyltransferase
MRPLNGVMAGAGVLVGAFVSRSPTWWGPAALGAFSAFAAAAAANAMNDRLDVEADRVNRPDRPVPSGRVTVGAATATAVVCGIVSVALAAGVGPRAAALALAWLALTALYSATLKGVPIVGNVAVALVASTPFLMGGFTQGKYLLALIPCSLAFLVHLAREIVKDVEDVEGDRTVGVRTFAVRRGSAASYALARAVMIGLMGLAAYPFAIGVYGWGYAAVVIVIDVALVWLMARMGSLKPGSRLPSNVLKVVMCLGLAAFVLGVVWTRAPF